ncbi:DUF7344 domain-containing protein [Haladaptatus salinisoli]|uniref:DUF7344 domain-containing protein n=1 Tax=Haladaptatus salinisoli TaxID=2884876 RepID=UPI001D0B1345|nr:hypothetical protein [Haladaptatus salinisoli]
MAALDRVFDLFSEERRRYALYFLEQENGPVSVDEVAEQIAEWKTNPRTVPIPEEKFDQIEVELRHNHLPKASEAEYITYDPKEEVVEITGSPPEFKAIISVAKVIERPERDP